MPSIEMPDSTRVEISGTPQRRWRSFLKRFAPPTSTTAPSLSSTSFSPRSTQSSSTTPTSSPIWRISQELLDEIIDSVANIDPWIDTDGYWDGRVRSLSACSLVSRAFLPRSQLHIFSKIRIGSLAHTKDTIPQCLERIKKLYSIMKRNPQIVAYVRELTLKTSPRGTAWITEDAYFRRILTGLVRPGNSFTTVSILGTRDCILDTRNPDVLFRIANSISSLHLGFMDNIPLAMIEACVHLIDLALICVEIDTKPFRIRNGKETTPRPRLQKFKFFNSSAAVKVLLARYRNQTPSHVDLSTIRVLFVNPASQEELLLAGEFIAIASSSLEKFKLHEQYETKTMVPRLLQPWVFKNFANLGNAINLRDFDVELSFQGFNNENEDPVAAISEILSTLPTPNQFRTLRIEMFIGQNNAVDPHDFHNLAWAPLASELRRISCGKPLIFMLKLLYRPPADTWTEEVVDDLCCHGYFHKISVLTPACEAIFQDVIHQKFEVPFQNSCLEAQLDLDPDFPRDPNESCDFDRYSRETISLLRH